MRPEPLPRCRPCCCSPKGKKPIEPADLRTSTRMLTTLGDACSATREKAMPSCVAVAMGVCSARLGGDARACPRTASGAEIERPNLRARVRRESVRQWLCILPTETGSWVASFRGGRDGEPQPKACPLTEYAINQDIAAV
jgi:hypothetical protein